jgi:DUF917 family protein
MHIISEKTGLWGFEPGFGSGHRIRKGISVSPMKAAQEAVEYLGGRVVAKGIVEELTLETREGFDVGSLTIRSGKENVEVTFWNEFMTLEQEGERLGTFPDLIALMDLTTGLPLPSADVKQSQEVVLVLVPRHRLILGAGDAG